MSGHTTTAAIDRAVDDVPGDLEPAEISRLSVLRGAARTRRQLQLVAAYERAVRLVGRDHPEIRSLAPTCAIACADLGQDLHRLGLLGQADRFYRRCLDLLNPTLATVDLPTAEREHRGLLRRDAGEAASVREFRGRLALSRGDYARGWAELEWRLWGPRRRDATGRNVARRWKHGDPNGRTILVRHEYGLGDRIQLLRFVPPLADRGARVVLEASPPLVRLARSLRGVAEICVGTTTRGPRPVPDFHVWVGLASLPHLFGTTPATIPTDIPYLHADPRLVAAWGERIRAAGPGVRVGLNWAGRSANPDERWRRLPLAALAPPVRVPGVRLFSLQKTTSEEAGWQRPADGGAETESAPAGMDLVRLGPSFADLADCAAAMMNLDLIITSDTAVAHLAGALGCRVWTLLPDLVQWHWALDREHSRWYPSMRLFRQDRLGDWAPVVARVAAELAHLAAARGAA